MESIIVTPPAMAPVLLTDVKSHLNVDHNDDDTQINGYILAATAHMENILNRKLVTQTWKAFFTSWPDEYFVVPFGKLQSVTSVKYKDTSAVEATLAATEYITDTNSDPGRIVLGYNKTWPTTELYPSNPITLQFVCGFGNVDAVPYSIKAAIMILVGDLYAHRESVVIGNAVMMATIPNYVMDLVSSYRLWNYFND